MPKLMETAAKITFYATVSAKSKFLLPYQAASLQRREAEVASYLCWWSLHYIFSRFDDLGSSDQELAGRTIEWGLKQQFPMMESILDDRYEDLETLLESDHREGDGELPISVYSVIALKGMDPNIEDADAANVLAQVVETLNEDLQLIWEQ